MAYTTINKPSDYFNTLIYTGDGTDNRSITGLGFQPDFCWFKDRTGANSHNLFDSVRGVNKPLISNSTSAELTGFNLFNSFDSDGFTISGATADNTNFNGNNFVSWSWKAGGTGVSNTNGSITSTVSANTTAGFSIVTYTGNGSAGATIGHGLGVKPSMMIVKRRDAVDSWGVWHKNLTSINYYLRLDGNTAEDSGGSTIWNSTEPTSSLITVGTSGYSNASSGTYVNYCFAEKKGFSKFGSYTGNGSTDGTFVYTGFKPAYLIVKRTDTTGRDWQEFDNKINPYNVASICLRPNVSNGDQVGNAMDLLSNGFKNRLTGGTVNASGGTYIYMAFAENPLVTSTKLPATAR